MELLSNLLNGFEVAFNPNNLLFCFIGVFLGTLIGALPGLGPTAGIAVLIPITAGLDPTTAIIMLAGLYYGSMYGSSTSSVLINTPGQAAAVLTAVEGFKLAQQGRAGPALGMSAIASFIGGTASLFGLVLLAPPLAQFALRFGPPEYAALMVLGLTIVISLSGDSMIKGLISATLGIMIGTIGMDPQSGTARFTFGSVSLLGGIDFVSVVVGLFAIAEVLKGGEEKATSIIREKKMKNLFPTRQDMKETVAPISRGSVIGFLVGLIPGGSSSVATFIAYDAEKKISKTPEKFGQGSMEGLAAVEGANNAATSGNMIPLLTLGIPASAPIAVLFGALMLHGLNPGPLLFENNPTFVWGLIASMYIGNVMLLILNLPLIGIWVKLINIPFPVLGPLVLVLCCVGTFSIRNSLFDVWVTLIFGIIGYVMKRVNVSMVPMILAVILGPMFEQTLRQAITISQGNISIFFIRPISLALLLLALASLFFTIYNRQKQLN